MPSAVCTAHTASWPVVSVPVLSSTTVSIRAKVSKLCPRLMSTPSPAKWPVEAASAAGVASDKAHGQVATKSDTVIHSAVCTSAYQAQPANTSTPSSKSAPTNQAA